MHADGQAGEDGGADALEGVGGDAVFGDLLDFGGEFALGEVELGGIGGEVEAEEAGVVAVELGGADLVGEAEFLADADEERAGHVAAPFLDHAEREAAGIERAAAGVGEGEHGLLFRQEGLDLEVAADFRRRGGPRGAGGQGGEAFGEEVAGLGGIEGPGEGDHGVGALEMAGVVGAEGEAVELRQRFLGAERG